MSITLGPQIASLVAQRRLGENNDALSKVFSRLSSGQRIQSASDDAAGLSVASTLNADSRIFTQAARNVNDGISLLNVAEGALKELSNIAIRIAELAEQSANGTYSTAQRTVMNQEGQALVSEYSRITQTASFNGQTIFDTASKSFTFQVGNSSSSNDRIAVQLGAPVTTTTGDGTFQAEQTISQGGVSVAQKVATGDVNNDGHQDIVWTSAGGGFVVAIGNGNGTFKVPATYGYLTGNQQGILVDNNSDGNLDFITIGGGNIDVSLGNGDGTFKVRSQYGAGTSNEFAYFDYNGDSISDVASFDGSNNVVINFANSNGSFQAAITLATAQTFGAGMVGGDINNDSKNDIIFSTTNGFQAYLGNGDGTFKFQAAVSTSGAARSGWLVDMNGDSKLDLVRGFPNTTNVSVILGNGDGTFKSENSYTTGSMIFSNAMVHVADFNGDGAPDIATNNGNSGTIGVLINNGNGTFKAYTPYTSSSVGYDLAAADFNEDGALDIVSGSSSTAQVSVFFGNPTTTPGFGSFSLTSQSGARSALTVARHALDSISQMLGQIGSYQSRLSSAYRTATLQADLSKEAASRITDEDIAQTAAELVRRQILQRAGQAVLLQANQEPKLALTLLK